MDRGSRVGVDGRLEEVTHHTPDGVREVTCTMYGWVDDFGSYGHLVLDEDYEFYWR